MRALLIAAIACFCLAGCVRDPYYYDDGYYPNRTVNRNVNRNVNRSYHHTTHHPAPNHHHHHHHGR